MACKIDEALKIVDSLLKVKGVDIDALTAARTSIVSMQKATPSKYSLAKTNVFTAFEKLHFANPLMRAMVKDLRVKIKEKDISGAVLVDAIRYNVAGVFADKSAVLTRSMIDQMYVSGAYDVDTNTITHPGSLVEVDKELQRALEESVAELEKLVPSIATVDIVQAIEPEWSAAVHRAVYNRKKDFRAHGRRVPIEVLLHELGHALTEGFVTTYPEHPVVMELSSIYENLKPVLMKDKYFASKDTYWQKDLEEFLSEALSNPKLIKKLAAIRVNNVKDVNSVLEAIVRFVSGLFGKNENTLYDAIMFRLAQIALHEDKEAIAMAIIEASKIGSSASFRLGSSKEDTADEDLLLGDDAMKNYKPKTATGNDVTKRFTDIIGNQVAVNYNGADAVDRMVSKVIDMGNYVNVVLENDGKYESYKFADGEATGVSAKGTKITIDRMDKFTSFVLGNKKDDSNWENLVKDETYIHGDTESMLKMLDTLHEMGGKKATDENMEYYRKLLGAMDPKFFKKMALFMKNTTQKSGGWVDGNSLHFKASKSKMLAGNQQTEAEIYLHEVVHTMTKFARLSGTAEARAIDRELEHAMAEMKKRTTWKSFLPAVSMDAKLEEKIAKEMYAYVFTSENAVDEFIAHVLTNPIVKSVAEKIMVQKDNKTTSLLDKVLNIFKSLVGVVMGNYAFDEKDKNVYAQVLNLATQLGEINNRAEAKKREHDNLLSTANNLLNSVDAKISRKLNELKDKWIVDDGERLEDYPSTANRFVKGKWLFKLLKKAVVNENYGKVLGLFASAYGMKPTGIVRNVLADFTEPTAYEKAVEWLQLESDKIEGARNTVISTGKKQVLDGFKKKLNAAEERALLRTVVDLDMAILFEGAANGKVYASHYKMPEIHKLLTDEAYLEKEIGKAKHRLKVAGGMEYHNWYKNQAVGLGYYLATGKANIAQNFNAVNIARGLGSTEYHTFDATTAREIDVIATLVGIQNTGVYEREIAANIIKNEKTGVINLMQMHKGYNEEAKKVLFDNNSTQMIKGYSKELFDDTLEVQIAPLSEREEMELSGFKFKGELKGKYSDKTATPMAMYISSSFGRNEWLRGATRLVGSGSRGTTVSDTKYADMGDFARERAARDIARLDVERLKLVQKQMDGEFLTSELEYGLAPVYNANGDVVNYRYMMDKNAKEDLLKQDTSVSETIGRTFGSMLDRANSKKHNKKVLKDILDNMDKNWTSGTLGNDLVTEYVVITANAHDKKIKELYRILPKEFKDAMNERADKSLAVPANMQDLYFGYRHLSIVDLPGFQRLMPKIIVELTRYAEAMWMELVKIAKTNILLKLPTVLLKNIISNFIQSVNRGVGLVTAFKLHLESFRDVRAYIKKNRELAKLELEMKTGKVKDATAERIKMIKADLKRNPVHELMSRGMYQAFQEDAENADLRGSNKLKKMMDKKLSMAPSFVRTPLQWLYLSEETAVYKMMQEVLQMSDLVFRDVANRAANIQEKNQADGKEDLPEWFLKESPGKPRRVLEGKERAKFLVEAREFNLYNILEMAINYNKPASSMEAYLNRIGPVRFTSYLKRIQKVAKQTTLEHPVRSALIALTEGYVYDFDTIRDQLGKGIPLYSPMDTLKDVATPSLIRYVDDII